MNTTGKKILALGFQFLTELEVAEPVIRQLNQDGHRCCLVFFKGLDSGLPKMTGLAKKKGLPYRVLGQSLAVQIEEKMSKKKVEFEQTLDQMWNDPIFQKACVYQGVNLWGVLEPCIRRHFLAGSMLQDLRYYELVKNLLDNEAPEALLVSSGLSLRDRLCCYLARSRRIRTVAIPHYSHQISILSNHLKDVLKPSLVDRWAVLGKAFKETLSQAGVEPHQVKITGLPKFEYLFHEQKFSNSKGSILLTLQGLPEDRLLLDELTRLMKNFPDKLLIVRPHPSVNTKHSLRSFRTNGARNVLIERKSTFEDLLKVSEILMTVSSVTAFEAILLDKQVIILNLASRFYPHIFVKEGAAIEVNRMCDIAAAIHDVISNSRVKDNLRAGRKRISENYYAVQPINSVRSICDLF